MASKRNRVLAALAVTVSMVVGALSLAVNTPAAAAQTNEAALRVIHASPDAPAVDIYVNGAKAISDLAFNKVSDWAMLPAGSYDVRVTAAGGTDAVIEATLPLEAGKYYSVAAVGKLADITAKVFEDNLTGLDAGKARLRVIHASPDAPAVDVAVKGGAVIVPSLAFPNASDYLTLDPITADVEVRPAGTTTVALAVPGLTLEAGKVYSVYAVGLLNGTPALSVLPVVDDAVAAAAPAPAPAAGGEASAGTTSSNGETMAPGMPDTGASENAFNLALIALALLAVAGVAAGTVVRVRNR
jgi:hypothetical protein